MPRCRCASSSPQAGCCIDHKPTGTSSQKIASNPSATRDMASDRRIQKKTHGPNHDQRKRRYTRGCNPKRHGAKATTTKAVCVLMPFLPKICYYVNCFRTCQPPTRMWETISRAGWPSSTDAAGNALFAHMPYLWNLRPEHQRIWANPKQTQTIQWARVPPNGMACTVTTNDPFRLACLLQLSA